MDLDKVRHHYEDDDKPSVTKVEDAVHADGDD